MKANDDQWIAEVITFVRTSFGNSAGAVTKDDVARIRAATADRTTPFAIGELANWTAVPASVMKGWTFSASLTEPRQGRRRRRLRHALGHRDRPDRRAVVPGRHGQADDGHPVDGRLQRLEQRLSARLEVRTSADGKTWSEPVAKGEAKEAVLAIPMPAGTVARYLRMIQTASGKTGLFWSIHELSVYGTAK